MEQLKFLARRDKGSNRLEWQENAVRDYCWTKFQFDNSPEKETKSSCLFIFKCFDSLLLYQPECIKFLKRVLSIAHHKQENNEMFTFEQ